MPAQYVNIVFVKENRKKRGKILIPRNGVFTGHVSEWGSGRRRQDGCVSSIYRVLWAMV